ncbi:MAG: hypothetical protein M3N16_08260 [Actinomycetota bacterium]|nr:hypothetical protein [Actinomycetota bacterium]
MAATELHPSEHRGYRELYVTVRRLAGHWEELARRLPGEEPVDTLRDGVAAARRLLEELAPTTADYGLHGQPAAQGLGARLADTRNQLRDRSLDRNQAVRFAVLDVQHVTTLLLYLAAVADSRGDERLAGFCRRWERSLRRIENAARKAAAATGADPDAAIEPLDTSSLGRAAHGAAYAMGSLGEWVDRRRSERRSSG